MLEHISRSRMSCLASSGYSILLSGFFYRHILQSDDLFRTEASFLDNLTLCPSRPRRITLCGAIAPQLPTVPLCWAAAFEHTNLAPTADLALSQNHAEASASGITAKLPRSTWAFLRITVPHPFMTRRIPRPCLRHLP